MKEIFETWSKYRESVRLREIDERIPDALFQAASFPAGHSVEEVIHYLGSAGSGPLKEEFRKASESIQRGSSVEKALKKMMERNQSVAVHRAVSLLIHGYDSGADANALFRETAEDVLETQSIIREQNASAITQKYTILLAAALLVPAILGSVSALSQSLSVQSVASFFGEGLSAAHRAELIQFIEWGTIAYLAENALLASVFASVQENNPKKWALYAVALVPLSVSVYFLAGGLV